MNNTPKTAVRSEALDECETRNVEQRIANADRQQGDDDDGGARHETNQRDRQTPKREREREWSTEPASFGEPHGVDAPGDATDAHGRSQPSDATVVQLEEIERNRNEQHGEESAYHDLRDKTSDHDGGVGVVA